MPKTDFRLWIVASMAMIVPSATMIYTYGQEQQKIEQLTTNFEKTRSEQLQINRELRETLMQVRIAMERITTKIEIMESK